MSDYLGEGSYRWINCPRCDEVVFEVQCGGLTSRLSRFSVPLSHATILVPYGHCVFNVWHGISKWFVRDWFPAEGRPSQGRLYVPHLCSIRK